MKRKALLVSVFLLILFFVGFFYLKTHLGGGGVNHIIPDSVMAGEPAIFSVVLTTWGGGAIAGRYTNISLGYRLVGEDTYTTLQPKHAVLPKNYQEAMTRNRTNQYEAYDFTLPPYPLGTTGEIEYYLDTTLDGHLNHQEGIKKVRVIANDLSSAVKSNPPQMTVGTSIRLTGTVLENVIKIDAPSYLNMLVSQNSEDRVVNVIYSGDLCLHSQRSGFDIKKGDRVSVAAKVTSLNALSVCDSKAYSLELVSYNEGSVDTSLKYVGGRDSFSFQYPRNFVVGKYKDLAYPTSPPIDDIGTAEDIEEMQYPFKKSVVLIEKDLIGSLLSSEIPVGDVSTIAISLKTGQKASFLKRSYIDGNFFSGGGGKYQVKLGTTIAYRFPFYPGPYGETGYYYLVPLSDGRVFEIMGSKDRFNYVGLSDKNLTNQIQRLTQYDQVIEDIIPTLTLNK